MKTLLGVAAALEAATGLVLMIEPSLLTRMILGAEVAGAGAGVGRLAGFALMGLALACWPLPETPAAAAGPLRGMLTYNVLITVYLVYVGLGGGGVGRLLWPTVGLHAVLTFLLARALLANRRTPAG
jgi:hypothetical protein